MGTDTYLREIEPSHANHLFQSDQRIPWTVGMNCRHRTLMTGGHGLQHVECFLAPNLTNDDSVGTHAKGVLEQFSLANLSLPLDAWGPRFQASNVRLLKLQLGGILDGDKTLRFGNET